jgi:hypothetical protein
MTTLRIRWKRPRYRQRARIESGKQSALSELILQVILSFGTVPLYRLDDEIRCFRLLASWRGGLARRNDWRMLESEEPQIS